MMVGIVRRSGALAVGLSLVAALQLAVPVAGAQCADPRGNSYCSNGGQVTFTTPPSQSAAPSQPCADPRGNAYCQTNTSPASNQPGQANGAAPSTQPQAPAAGTVGGAAAGTTGQAAGTTGAGGNSPAVQPNAPAAPDASISIDPSEAPAGAQVTLTGHGLGGGRSAWVNLSHMTSTGGLNLGAKQLGTINTAPDGSVSATLTIPTVPSWTAGSADICVINATADPVCTQFTLGSAQDTTTNSATTSDAIIGHYQCSSALLVGFGGGFCTGGEPILALNDDGTYTYGDEQGSWSFDGSTVSFDGSLGSATVLNRKLTIDTTVDTPDGSGSQEVRYTYIRMNY